MTEDEDSPWNSPDFGCNSDGSFNDLTRAYKRNPTIENYLTLRRENPDEEIEVAIHGGVDQLFCVEAELARYGINADEFVSIFDADDQAISHFSLFFMEKIVEARKLAKAGETHLVRRGLAVPDKLIDWFITCSLDALSWTGGLEINRDLIVLIRERLGGPFPEYEMRSAIRERKMHATIVAGSLKAQGHMPSIRQMAKAMNVAPSTFLRWFGLGNTKGKQSDGRKFTIPTVVCGTFHQKECCRRMKVRNAKTTDIFTSLPGHSGSSKRPFDVFRHFFSSPT